MADAEGHAVGRGAVDRAEGLGLAAAGVEHQADAALAIERQVAFARRRDEAELLQLAGHLLGIVGGEFGEGKAIEAEGIVGVERHGVYSRLGFT